MEKRESKTDEDPFSFFNHESNCLTSDSKSLKYNRGMNKRFITGIVLAGIGAICLVIGFWPFKQVPFSVPVKLSSGQQAVISGSLPARAWVGEEFTLNLSFKLDSPADTSSGHLRAAVDLSHAKLSPQGDVSLTFDPAGPVKLAWKVTPESAGTLRGTLWVYAGVNELPITALLARDFQVSAITFLGVTARWYRWAAIGFIAAGVFFILAFSRLSAGSKRTQGKGVPARQKRKQNKR